MRQLCASCQGNPVPKILVADDNTNIQKMVSLAFEERGIQVVAVGNGETAVRKLPDVNPDLVLADVFMPVRNGYEVCEFVKKDTRFAHIPVILLVGAFDPLDEKEARRVGADGVLKKPFVPPDPLIAMVMSALEKNPRVAAELAKAKETPKEEPLPQVLEIATKKEPAPLPEFPEPTAEEAAQIYGFGKGVRAADDEDDPEETEKKSREAKAPKAAKPAAAKPAAVKDDEDEEGFDPSATRRDRWRSGLDLEIPADVAAQPAFSSEPDFGAITFPSEKDVPPKRVRPPESTDEVDVAKVPSADYGIEKIEEVPAQVRGSQPLAAENLQTEALAPTATAEQPAESRGESISGSATAPAPEAPAQSNIEAAPQDAAPARISHWMDMMAPEPSSEYRSGSWLQSLAPKQESAASAAIEQSHAEAPAASAAPESPAVQSESREDAHAEALVESKNPTAAEEIPAYHAPAAAEPLARDEREPIVTPQTENRSFGDDSSRGASSYHFGSSDYDAHAVTEDQGQDAQSSESHQHSAPFAAEEADQELQASATSEGAREETSAFFAEETATVPTDYFEHGSGAGPVPPAASEIVSEPTPEPASYAIASEEDSSIFSSGLDEPSERIPTVPPENREALAGIPFLMPSLAEISSNGKHADSGAVDAAVERVLERLGPQLQEMLTQGLLKPIVEQLLQQELEKKER